MFKKNEVTQSVQRSKRCAHMWRMSHNTSFFDGVGPFTPEFPMGPGHAVHLPIQVYDSAERRKCSDLFRIDTRWPCSLRLLNNLITLMNKSFHNQHSLSLFQTVLKREQPRFHESHRPASMWDEIHMRFSCAVARTCLHSRTHKQVTKRTDDGRDNNKHLMPPDSSRTIRRAEQQLFNSTLVRQNSHNSHCVGPKQHTHGLGWEEV